MRTPHRRSSAPSRSTAPNAQIGDLRDKIEDERAAGSTLAETAKEAETHPTHGLFRRYLRRRTRRRRQRSSRHAGICCRRAIYVGLGADGPRLPEALFVLLGLADRRPEAAAAGVDAVSTKSSSYVAKGFRFIALADDNFYPVTLDGSRDGRAPAQHRAARAAAGSCAPSDSS